MPPKDDLLALTGGYRGTPVLQIGADIYIDSQRIAAELEARFPQPTLFPGGNPGLALAGGQMGRCVLSRRACILRLRRRAALWPPNSGAIARALFPDIDFDAATPTHARRNCVPMPASSKRNWPTGATFLAGDAPGLLGRSRVDRAVVHARAARR